MHSKVEVLVLRISILQEDVVGQPPASRNEWVIGDTDAVRKQRSSKLSHSEISGVSMHSIHAFTKKRGRVPANPLPQTGKGCF